MQQAEAGGALPPVPVVFRDSLPAPCGEGGAGGGGMEPINRRTEHERSRHLYVSSALAEAAEYVAAQSSVEIWRSGTCRLFFSQ